MKNSLHNLCSSISDGEHGTVIDVPHSGFFLLSSKNLIAGKVVFDSSDRQISETDFLRIKNRMRLKKGTVLISTVGEIGKTALIEEDNTPFVFQRSVGALNIHTDLILPEYVFYVLQYPAYQRYLAQKSGGSVQKGLYLDDIGGVIVSYPFNIADQKHIVDIIGSIDRSIEQNKSESKILIDLAKRAYKAFFENTNSSFERRETSETKQGYFSSMGTFLMGQSPKGDTYNDQKIGLPLINGAADYSSGVIAPSKFTSAPVRICKKDDLIFCVRATLGNIVFSDKEYCLGRGVAALRPYPFFRCFSYFKLAEAMEHFNNTLSGSIMIEITKDQLLNFPLEIPSREKLEEFEALVSPTIEKFKLLQQENGLLESKKHFLLPLLLDGQIL